MPFKRPFSQKPTEKLSLLSGELLAAAAKVRENPRFAEALGVFAHHYVEAFSGNLLLSKIATEDARHLLCGHMVALHYRREVDNPESGIVLRRLQEFASEHNLCSKNRVASLVCLLKHADYLRPARRDGDKRVTRLAPTKLAGGALRKFIVAFLKALDRLNDNDGLQSRLDRDERLPEAIVANAIEMYFDACAHLDAVPRMRLFSGRDAGYEILLRLWTTFDTTRSPVGQIVSFPYGLVGKTFGVSRAHVRRLMETAARRGYFDLCEEGGRAVEIRPSLVELVESFVSLQLALYQSAINRVSAEARDDLQSVRSSSVEVGGVQTSVASATLAMGAGLRRRGQARARGVRDLIFGLSVPFVDQDSFRQIIAAYENAVSELGGTLIVADANWRVGKQNEQIDSFIASKPDALFVLPIDPVAISRAVQSATAAGIPTFLSDSAVPGANACSTSMHNHFGMGFATAEYICKRLRGKGKIAAVHLLSNDAWSTRSDGMRFMLSRYPDIEIVADLPFLLSGPGSEQQAIEGMLAAHDDIDAIWSAWDGGAVGAALAIQATGRKDIFATGIDGGSEAFEFIKNGSAFCFTVAQSFYDQSYLNVYYAHEVLAGRGAPRMIVNPAYAVGQKALSRNLPGAYVRRGVADELGWRRVL
jgi:ribose transport system substrate-binding protein